MRKNKKGFTLVELLAVIIILAVIMVIATQQVTSVTKKNTVKAFKSSLDIIAKEAKKANTMDDAEGVNFVDKVKSLVDYDENQYTISVEEKKVCITSQPNGKFSNMSKEYLVEVFGVDEEYFDFDGGNVTACRNYEGDANYDVKKSGEIDGEKIDVDSLEQGDEITIDGEQFYIISTDGDEVKMLAKYNLLVGNVVTNGSATTGEPQSITPISEDTPGYGRQSEDAKGGILTETTFTGIIPFAEGENGYWQDDDFLEKYGKDDPADVYPINVYDGHEGETLLYDHLKNYENIIQAKYPSAKAKLIAIEELESLGCHNIKEFCKNENVPKWVYETSSWTGIAYASSDIMAIETDYDSLGILFPNVNERCGLRPVIVIKKSDF